MREFFRYLRKKRFKYRPLVEVLILSQNLLHNLREFQSANSSCKIAPVLKSNAYGHGLIGVAKIFDLSTIRLRRSYGAGGQNVPFLVVDSYYEAVILRNEGIKSNILIIGHTRRENLYKNDLKNIAFTINSLDELKEISANLRRETNFHIKIDTGMHRNGILTDELNDAVAFIKINGNIVIEGICSHLADADGKNMAFTLEQIKKWNEVAEKWYKNFPDTKYFHLSATAGAHYSDYINANVMRIGLGLYGISARKLKNVNLKPALEMRSIVSSIKKIKKGDKVGYNVSFEAKHDMKIATVPVGYYEGVDRRLSNKGSVIIREKFCDIIGTVSMNVISVDISDLSDVKNGDEVVIISSKANDKNSVQNISELCDTIPYEILVHIPERLKRVVAD